MPYVQPNLLAGGHISVATNADGTTYNAFASTPCGQVTIVNDTGVDLEVRQDGAGVAIVVFNGQPFTFYGLSNANQLGVRRKDASVTPVTLAARWEK